MGLARRPAALASGLDRRRVGRHRPAGGQSRADGARTAMGSRDGRARHDVPLASSQWRRRVRAAARPSACPRDGRPRRVAPNGLGGDRAVGAELAGLARMARTRCTDAGACAGIQPTHRLSTLAGAALPDRDRRRRRVRAPVRAAGRGRRGSGTGRARSRRAGLAAARHRPGSRRAPVPCHPGRAEGRRGDRADPRALRRVGRVRAGPVRAARAGRCAARSGRPRIPPVHGERDRTRRRAVGRHQGARSLDAACPVAAGRHLRTAAGPVRPLPRRPARGGAVVDRRRDRHRAFRLGDPRRHAQAADDAGLPVSQRIRCRLPRRTARACEDGCPARTGREKLRRTAAGRRRDPLRRAAARFAQGQDLRTARAREGGEGVPGPARHPPDAIHDESFDFR